MSEHDHQDEMSGEIEQVEQEIHDNAETLGNEFREFGRQLMRALRSIAESDELRHLGTEIGDSLREIGEEVQETLHRTRSATRSAMSPSRRAASRRR